jgi:hypothetical protein
MLWVRQVQVTIFVPLKFGKAKVIRSVHPKFIQAQHSQATRDLLRRPNTHTTYIGDAGDGYFKKVSSAHNKEVVLAPSVFCISRTDIVLPC